MNQHGFSRPDRRLVLVEAPRVLSELASLIPAAPFLFQAPRGDGHSVLVVPGLGASDRSTGLLRGFLDSMGYRSHAWSLGINRGPGMPNLLSSLATRLAEVFAAADSRKVSIVGWSLGGVYGRLLAHHHPEKVRQVITLGSPFAASPDSTSSPVRLLAGEPLPGIPSTALFSKTDAIVPWQMATQTPTEIAENVEVYGSHIGLGFNPAVLYAAADRLANPEGQWQPMRRRGWKRFVYGPALLESSTEQSFDARSTAGLS
jgi:pimeloyl-ACP methyl ester carboxylesterase